MTPAELIAAGELVYGSQWRKPLAEAVGYSRRMIWYYEFGERQIGLPCRKWSKARVRIGPLLKGEFDAASEIYAGTDHRQAA